MLVLRSRFKLCVDQHPGYILQNVGQLSVPHPTLVICVVLRCRGRSSEPEVGPLSGPPKVGYQKITLAQRYRANQMFDVRRIHGKMSTDTMDAIFQ